MFSSFERRGDYRRESSIVALNRLLAVAAGLGVNDLAFVTKPPSPLIYNNKLPESNPSIMEVFRISDQSEAFRPGKLLCIGRNYAKHAKELGNEVPEDPMVFLKPASALIGNGDQIIIPKASTDVHHEVELVALIGKKGKQIPLNQALEFVAGYAVGLDMTARDLQSKAKAKGHPWSVAKGFDTFAPLGAFAPATAIEEIQSVNIELQINGATRQLGNTSDMIFSVAYLIHWCSSIFTLMPGDLLFTGTPEGVSQVHPGDQLVAKIDGLPELHVGVRAE